MLKLNNRIVGLVITVVAIAGIVLTPMQVKIYGDSFINQRFLPYLIFTLMLLGGIMMIFVIKPEKYQMNFSSWQIAIPLILYALFLDWIGFLLSTTLFFVAMGLVWGNKKPLLMIVGSILGSVVLYIIFYWGLRVPLPMGFGS